jgi:hypothetical protein
MSMKSYDQIGFLSYVSKTTGKPLVLVSADTDRLDLNGNSFDRQFSMLTGDCLDEIRHSGCSIIELDTMDEAQVLYLQMQEAALRAPNVGLYAVVFFDGATALGISQENSTALPVQQEQVTLLIC